MLRILEIHAARESGQLNDEWFVVENPGPNDFSVAGCKLIAAKNKDGRGSIIGTLDPGFVLHPGEKVRLITGSPGKKAHGAPPDEEKDCKNYHLFLGGPVFQGAGSVVRIVLNQLDVAKATFDPKAKSGTASE